MAQANEIPHEHDDTRTSAPPWRGFYDGNLWVYQSQVHLYFTGQLNNFLVNEEKSCKVVFLDESKFLLKPSLSLRCNSAVAALSGLHTDLL